MLVQLNRVREKHFTPLCAMLETALIALGLVAMFLLLPRRPYIDGILRFDALSKLLEHRSLSNTRYSLIGPVFSIPLWLVGKLFATSYWWCERYNLFVFAAGLLAVYRLLKDRVDRGLLRKFFLILISASMFANHISAFGGEVFTAMCVGVGILAVVVRSSWRGWSAVVLGVANTPASLLGLGCLILSHILENKRWRYILIFIIALGLILAEAWIRRGGPFVSGYGNEQFSNPFFFGLISILFSFGKGIFFFAPGLLLPINSSVFRLQQTIKLELYKVYTLWISFLVGLVLVYSAWWAWYGGWFWGPRFFLFASLPASFALAVRLHQRDASLFSNLATLIVLGLSVWVGIDGAIFDQNTLYAICISHHQAQMYVCLYVPEFSALWRPFVVNEHLELSDIIYIVYCLIVCIYLAVPSLKVVVKQVTGKVRDFSRA